MAAGSPVSRSNAPAATATLKGPLVAAATVAAASAYTAHASGSTAVTSNAATDLDTTAAQVAALTTAFNALRTSLRNAGHVL